MWELAAVFKIFGAGLTALRAWPAFVSTLSVAAALWAARPFGGRNLSLAVLVVTLANTMLAQPYGSYTRSLWESGGG